LKSSPASILIQNDGRHTQRISAARRQALPVENGEFRVPYKIETPNPIDIKFDTDDYVLESKPITKFGANPSILQGNVKYNYLDFLRVSAMLKHDST